ncbi:hypothetical protein ALI44B_06140 [Leifsonia sp. ALI-44-B]|jgi:hypothetical protein|uniref:hypothetical protein n=1 Tax=Leifsonia sp. ALI-44-B TaxID=1933776 RepID=UPI00097C2109|nr:hypothetical protein [Leifsonia sp. ALI-44-B]ONI64147.1 hypothetical protein ALI44B_06140 [Leifsonia sp. ALI-44-B]
MSDVTLTPKRAWRGIASVWVAAVVLAIAVGVLVDPALRFSWLALALAACALLTFGIQLGTTEKTGFIARVSASVAGALIILSIAAGIFTLVYI